MHVPTIDGGYETSADAERAVRAADDAFRTGREDNVTLQLLSARGSAASSRRAQPAILEDGTVQAFGRAVYREGSTAFTSIPHRSRTGR